MMLGYARVSTTAQDLQLQIDALKEAGVEEQNIYTDKVSGVKKERPGFDQVLKVLRKGDTLIVWRLDRMGRSFKHLIEVVTSLKEKGIKFKSIQEGLIDTTNATGELIFHLFAVLSQFERALTQERVSAGLRAARSRGLKGGRKPIQLNNTKVKAAKNLYKDHSLSIKEICKQLNISRTTFYRYIKMDEKYESNQNTNITSKS